MTLKRLEFHNAAFKCLVYNPKLLDTQNPGKSDKFPCHKTINKCLDLELSSVKAAAVIIFIREK